MLLTLDREEFQGFRRNRAQQRYCGRLVFKQSNRQVALVFNEAEHLPDAVLVSVRNQARFPPEIAGLRLQVAEEGNTFRMGRDVGLADPAQSIEERDRIRTRIEQFA